MTSAQVAAIFEMLKRKSYGEIAREFQITKAEVRKIALGRKWRIAEERKSEKRIGG
jgi:hypothetical protein